MYSLRQPFCRLRFIYAAQNIFFQFLAFLKGRFFPEIVQLSGLHEMKLNFFFRDKEPENLTKMSAWECYMHLLTLI